MIAIDANTMRAIVPTFKGTVGAKQTEIINTVGPFLVPVLDGYAINTRYRIAHFLAQCAQESAGFRTMEEFASGQEYEWRTDLGNNQKGDGRKFKGRGLIQLTGRANYAQIGHNLGLDLVNHPTWATLPANALKIACEYWKSRNINAAADRDDLLAVTRMVNGGTNGLNDRRAYLVKAKIAVTAAEAGTIQPLRESTEPVLYRGILGKMQSITYLQTGLSKLGARIAIDGDFGAATEMAVMDFQEQQNLAIDGIVGPATWNALDVAVKVI